MARRDTMLESEGAEFLVLGNLLLERIPAYKNYSNMRDYDLVAINPLTNCAVKIQVKSRWETNAAAFPIKKIECDFVVFCQLNRGGKSAKSEVKAPEFFVFPVAPVKAVHRVGKFSKVYLKEILAGKSKDDYLNRWDLIRDKLELPSSGITSEQENEID